MKGVELYGRVRYAVQIEGLSHREAARQFAIDDASRRAGFPLALLSARHIKGVMDAIQRAIAGPQVEIVEQRAARRQILRDRTPLASRTQNIHDAVHHFPHIDVPPVAAAFGQSPSLTAQSSAIKSLGQGISGQHQGHGHHDPHQQAEDMTAPTIKRNAAK